MKFLRFAVTIMLACAIGAKAQPNLAESFTDQPVEITADGETRFEGGVAVAEDNVQIHYGGISIYAEYAEYNPDTREVLLVDNVRIYTPENLFAGQRALYNLETKQIRALEFAGDYYPLKFRALSLRAPSFREFRVRDATLTTHDSSRPDWRVRSKSVRIYPDDRVILSRTTLYIGNVPVFWFPYLFGNLDNTGFEVLPGYDSRWGAFLLTAYSFPIGESIIAKPRLDYRTERGIGIGFEATAEYGKDNRSYGDFLAYYAYDLDPGERVGGPGEPAETGDPDRYRVTFRHKLFLTDDIYVTADMTKLSDVDMLEDYFPVDFRVDPQPDNFVDVTKWDEFFTLSLLTRWQMNNFYQTTERLPDLTAAFKQHELFGLPVNYDGNTGVAQLRRAFATTEINPDYDSLRFDSFHQFSLPNTYFGFLSIVPRMGIRGTYYSKSGESVLLLSENQLANIEGLENSIAAQQQGIGALQQALREAEQNLIDTRFDTDATQEDVQAAEQQVQAIRQGIINSQNSLAATQAQKEAAEVADGQQPGIRELGSVFRTILNAGVEGSFKISKTYEQVQTRLLGLDGLKHVIQPYVNYSYVNNFGPPPTEIFQFDRLIPSTQPLPLEFPQFTSIDSISSWNIARIGFRNRLQTRRDNDTLQWLLMDTFIDVNLDSNRYLGTSIDGFTPNYLTDSTSNIVHLMEFRPVPWMTMRNETQIPTASQGFYEFNTSVDYMVTKNWYVNFAHRYIDNNQFFEDSSRITATTYYQINDHWAVSLAEEYEFFDNQLLFQRYSIHRDLTSWIATIGVSVRDNSNPSGGPADIEYGVLFTMTLKDAPQVALPVSFDQGTSPLTGGN